MNRGADLSHTTMVNLEFGASVNQQRLPEIETANVAGPRRLSLKLKLP